MEPPVDQFEGRLRDADVRLDPGEGQVANVPFAELFFQAVDTEAMKGELLGAIGDQGGDLGDGRSEPLRILLGRPDGDREHLRRFDQADGVGDDKVAEPDRRQELFLEVDDEQAAVSGGQAVGRGHGRAIPSRSGQEVQADAKGSGSGVSSIRPDSALLDRERLR